MCNFHFYKKRSIYLSLIIAIILQLMFSYTVKLRYYQTSWVMLLLIYWVIKSPKQVNIGTGFFLGLTVDSIFHFILGIHALSYSLITYLVIKKFYFFQNLSILQQSFFIILLSLINRSFELLIIFLITNILYPSKIFLSCMLDGFLWPFLFLFLNKIFLHH